MPASHHYKLDLNWTGSEKGGTTDYKTYSRDFEIYGPEGKKLIGSADPAFRGDLARWNPEELLLASVASCHKLWYLHLCAVAGICVTQYEDACEGVMEMAADGGGAFTGITLRPHVTISEADKTEEAASLHEKAHGLCFIARSVNFPVHIEPDIITAS